MKGLFAFSLLLSVAFGRLASVDKKIGESLPSKSRSRDVSITTETIDNSCIGKEDGSSWIKFSDEDPNYVPVYLECSNEYAILDYSKDSNIEKYFSSWQLWHYGTAGPKNSNPVTWEQWFLGNKESSNANYLVSPDCSVCDESSDRQLANTKSTYWLSGNLAKQFWWNFGYPQCDMDYETYECYSCEVCADVTLACDAPSLDDVESSDDFENSGICTSAIRESTSFVPDSWRNAALGEGSDGAPGNPVFKPSIGIDNRFCVCYKPGEGDFNQYRLTSHDISVINEYDATQDKEKTDETSDDDGDNIYYISQKDFIKGPLRIKKSGTYIFTEDIVFDFGAENEYPYFPDIKEKSEYPGAGEYRGEWHMGYFAGITIETDDVTIDLGGYELKQSIEFYFQQRFFTHIELSSGQFLPGQGPAFFGENPAFISNFELRNGILGRSSHFGIHGNYPNGFILKDVHIRDFGTHGIQLNGWENVEMDNIEIGPSSTEEWLLGDYAHARLMVPRLKDLVEELNMHGRANAQVSIPNRYNNNIRGITVSEVLSQLEYEMSLAYDYAMNRYENKHKHNDYITPSLLNDAPNDEHWKAAKEQFIWEDGLPSATSLHGIFLNTHSVSVATFTFSSGEPSHGAKLNNIRIHDLQHSLHENVRLSFETVIDSAGITPWNSMWDGRGVFGGDENLYKYYDIMVSNFENDEDEEDDDSWKDFEYVGNVLTDSYVVTYEFSESWDYTGFLLMSHSFYSWVLGNSADDPPVFNFGCNHDVMIHSGKGLLGLRMDAVYDVEINDIYIYNLHERTPLGATFCGEYDGTAVPTDDNGGAPGSGGHFRQVTPIQTGFSGNMLQGVSITGAYDITFSGDIIISNLRTNYGEIFGFSVWPNSDVTIAEGSNMVVSNFKSGIELTDDIIEEYGMTYESRPNRLPESCAIRLENKDPEKDYSAASMDDSVLTFENGIENSHVITCDMAGHTYCIGDESNGNTLYGDEYDGSDICNDLLNDISEDKHGWNSNGDSTTGGDDNYDDKAFLKSIVRNNNNNNNSNKLINNEIFNILIFIIGVVIVGALGLLAKMKNNKTKTTFNSFLQNKKQETTYYGSTLA